MIICAAPGRWRYGVGATVLALASWTSPVAAQLPTLGDTSDLSAAAERRIGDRIARELYRDPDYIDDPVLDEYVQGIWQPLLAAARRQGELSPELDQRFAWMVLLGKDRSVNAFAVPGGWLGLHLGLIAVTATRDELASVLAHELSHVTQRHISRLISQDKRQAPWMIGAMILGALAASKRPDAANAVITGSQALAMQNQLNFSRDMEREADRVGLGVLTQAGFQPQGFVGMFEKLQQASRLNDSGALPYLRTHPLNNERMADMQLRLQSDGAAPAVGPTLAAAADLEHHFMAARARVLSANGVDALRALAREVDDAPVPAGAGSARAAAALYAAALAASRLREPALAARLHARLQPLVARDPRGARLTRLLGAELALQAGEAARAFAESDVSAGRRPELLLAAQSAARAGRAAEVAPLLQTWVASRPQDATAWLLLAGAYAAQGQSLRAIRAEAEAQVAVLDYAAALDRLRAGQDLARRNASGGDHIDASIIDTRARQVEALVRQQQQDDKLER